jgi:hypothetical protein
MYTDATSSRRNNRNISVRNYSTDEYTLLYDTNTKYKSNLKKTGILSQYLGTLLRYMLIIILLV